MPLKTQLTSYAQGRYTEAEALWLELLERSRRLMGDEHVHTLSSMQAVAMAYFAQGKYAEAEPLLLEAYERLQQGAEAPPEEKRAVLEALIKLYDAWGKPDKAAEWRGKLGEESDEVIPIESGQAPPRSDEGKERAGSLFSTYRRTA